MRRQTKTKTPVIEITPQLKYAVVAPCKCGKGRVTHRSYHGYSMQNSSCPECDRQYHLTAEAPVIRFEPKPDDWDARMDGETGSDFFSSYNAPSDPNWYR